MHLVQSSIQPSHAFPCHAARALSHLTERPMLPNDTLRSRGPSRTSHTIHHVCTCTCYCHLILYSFFLTMSRAPHARRQIAQVRGGVYVRASALCACIYMYLLCALDCVGDVWCARHEMVEVSEAVALLTIRLVTGAITSGTCICNCEKSSTEALFTHNGHCHAAHQCKT